MSNNNPEKIEWETRFRNAQDVNELIRIARSAWAETKQAPAELIPLDEDAAMDLVSGYVSNWILMCERLPVDSKERVTQAVESLIDALRRLQSAFPDDPEELKKICFTC